jgi:hypothetical protein
MQTLLLFMKVLPLLLEILKMLQQRRASIEAAEQIVADLTQAADYLIMGADLARAKVKDTDDEIANDPFNRD